MFYKFLSSKFLIAYFTLNLNLRTLFFDMILTLSLRIKFLTAVWTIFTDLITSFQMLEQIHHVQLTTAWVLQSIFLHLLYHHFWGEFLNLQCFSTFEVWANIFALASLADNIEATWALLDLQGDTLAPWALQALEGDQKSSVHLILARVEIHLSKGLDTLLNLKVWDMQMNTSLNCKLFVYIFVHILILLKINSKIIYIS